MIERDRDRDRERQTFEDSRDSGILYGITVLQTIFMLCTLCSVHLLFLLVFVYL